MRGLVSHRQRRNLQPQPRNRGASTSSNDTNGLTLADKALRYFRDKASAGDFQTLNTGSFNLEELLSGMQDESYQVVLQPGFALRAKHGQTRGNTYMIDVFKAHLNVLFDRGAACPGLQMSAAQMLVALKSHFLEHFAFPTEAAIQSYVSSLKKKRDRENTDEQRERKRQKVDTALSKAREVRKKHEKGKKELNRSDYLTALSYLYLRDGKSGASTVASGQRKARLEAEYGEDWISLIPLASDPEV